MGFNELNDVLPIAPQLYEGLRKRILFAQLRPGELISETEIAKFYGISRQPVREAFIKLAEAKLVQIRPQRGTMIAYISHEAVMDARFVREAIEADVVKQAAEKCDAAGRAELKAQLNAQRQYSTIDEKEFLRLDDLFHQTLAEISGHSSAWTIIEDLKVHMDRVRYLSVREPHMNLLINQHQEIADAVCANDPLHAETKMRGHLREILKSLPELEANRPEFFSARG